MPLTKIGEMEKAFPRQSKSDKPGQYSYLLTGCKNWLYCHNGSYMKYDGCICPKCGRTIIVDTQFIT